MKRLAGLTAVALATLLALILAWAFRQVIAIFALSLALAAALRPLVDYMVERRWPRGAALLLVYGLTVALVAAGLIVMSPPLASELRLVADRLASAYDRIYANWPEGSAFQSAAVQWLPPPSDLYAAFAGPRGEAMFQRLFGLTATVFGALSAVTIVFFLSLYWGIDQARFERLWLALLPAERRARAREIWRSIETGVGAYVRSEVTQGFVAAVLLGVGYWLVGVPYPILLALAGAVAWLIPYLGAVLGLLPVLAVTWPVSPLGAVLATALTMAVYLALELVVQPRLYSRQQYNSLLIVLTMLALSQSFGLVGLLIAPPLAAALQILLTRLLEVETAPEAQPWEDQYEALQARLAEVRHRLAAGGETPEPQLLNMVERLDQLVGEAGDALRAEAGRRRIRSRRDAAPQAARRGRADGGPGNGGNGSARRA